MLIPKPREVEVKHVMITINQCKVEIMNSREVEVKRYDNYTATRSGNYDIYKLT